MKTIAFEFKVGSPLGSKSSCGAWIQDVCHRQNLWFQCASTCLSFVSLWCSNPRCRLPAELEVPTWEHTCLFHLCLYVYSTITWEGESEQSRLSTGTVSRYHWYVCSMSMVCPPILRGTIYSMHAFWLRLLYRWWHELDLVEPSGGKYPTPLRLSSRSQFIASEPAFDS